MGAAIDRVEVSVFRIPTDRPESDGTLEWDSTTMVVVECSSGDCRGLPDRLICDGQTIMCPAGGPPRKRAQLDSPAQPDQLCADGREAGDPGQASSDAPFTAQPDAATPDSAQSAQSAQEE